MKCLSWRRSISILLCIAVCIPCYATNPIQPRPKELRQARFSLPPWSIKDNNDYIGAHITILEEISKKLDVKLVYIECAVERCEKQLLSGLADIVIGMKVTAKREQFIHYLDPPLLKKGYSKVFYQRIDDYRLLAKYDDLYAYTIGVNAGSKLFLPFDDDQMLHKDFANSLEQNFKKLARGRIDVVACPEGLGEYMLAKLELRNQFKKSIFRIEDPTPRRIGIAKASPWAHHRHDIETVLTELTQTGTIRRIIESQYFERFSVPKDAVTLAW